MKKIPFILLLCICSAWSKPLAAQTINVHGFWPDQAVWRDVSTGVLLNTCGSPSGITNIPIGGNGSRMTIAIEYSGFVAPMSAYIPYMGIEILNATTGATVATMPCSAYSPTPGTHADAVIVNTYTASPGGISANFVNVTVNVPLTLVSGTSYKVRFFIDVPGPANYKGTGATATTFYSDFAFKTSLGADINASSYDASTMPTLAFTGGGTAVTDVIWFEWYIGTTRICSGYTSPYNAGNFITIPPITAVSATGWTYLSAYPSIQAGLTNITNDMTIRLNVWAGSNVSTFKIQYGDEIVIDVPSPAPAEPTSVLETTLIDRGLALHIYPNPSQDDFTVNLDVLSHADKIEVHDIMGKQIFTAPVYEGQASVNIQASEWDNGMYFVKLYARNELIGSNKILKARTK